VNSIIEALSLLTPYDVNKCKVRIGHNRDGGYILLDDFAERLTVISYGIGNEYSFDEDMAKRGLNVYMFDHTIDGIKKISDHMEFFKEGVAGVTDQEKNLYTIEDHIRKYDLMDKKLIMKMDVDGAEYDAVGMASNDILARFDQIVMEIHFLDRIGDEGFRFKFCKMMRKLNNLFTIFHVHLNNCDNPQRNFILPGVPIACLLEVSFVRTVTILRYPSMTLYPTSLDFPGFPAENTLLWFFPFLPTSLPLSTFVNYEERK